LSFPWRGQRNQADNRILRHVCGKNQAQNAKQRTYTDEHLNFPLTRVSNTRFLCPTANCGRNFQSNTSICIFLHIFFKKDYPILASAIIADVDVFITGDKDFGGLDLERPEMMSISDFEEKYLPPF
jgi:hypothetical protein